MDNREKEAIWDIIILAITIIGVTYASYLLYGGK